MYITTFSAGSKMRSRSLTLTVRRTKGLFTHNVPFSFHSPATTLPFSCYILPPIIQTLMSLHQNNRLLLVHDKRCFVSHWPPSSEIGMLLITNFLELDVVAERRRTLAGRQHAVPPLFLCRHPAATLPWP
jgi:hypothetical protein